MDKVLADYYDRRISKVYDPIPAIRGGLSVNDAKAFPGDKVYLTLTLRGETIGDAIGVEFS